MPTLNLNTGVDLHYKLRGEGETVVFVNGLTMDTTSWQALEQHFHDYATLRYDCRGQGESGKPAGPYPPTQHRDDLIALLDALKVRSFHLVGLSNGGLISMLTAGRLFETGRVKSVTTIDSLLGVDPMLRTVLRSWKAALLAGGSALRFDVATPWVWGHSFLNEHLEEVLAFRERAAAADPEVIGYLIDGAEGFGHAGETLQAYSGPLLAVVGEEDLLTPVRYSREIAETARSGRLVVLERAGHAAPIERPAAVAQVVRDFLECAS